MERTAAGADSGGGTQASVRGLLVEARDSWLKGDLAGAARAAKRAACVAPDDPGVLRMHGMVLQRRGEYQAAARCFSKVLATWPVDAELRVSLGISLFECGSVKEAMEELREATRLAPESARGWFNLGEALWRNDEPGLALPALRRAVEIEPSHVSARVSLARVESSLGHFDRATAQLRAVLQLVPDNADAWHALGLLGGRFTARDVAELQRWFDQTQRPCRERELLGFTLAKALESRGDFVRAFAVLEAANELQRRHVHWSEAAEHRRVREIKRTFSGSVGASGSRLDGREVIFITSLPRTGSTLVEQILASHRDVEGANEIKVLRDVLDRESARCDDAFPHWVRRATPQTWHRLGIEYLDRTKRYRSVKPRFTDKNLNNWRFIGAALAMLPSARVVVVRRDPVETCLGCFRQCLTDEMGFACDLEATVQYLAGFVSLTRFWVEKTPDRVITVEYEELVVNPVAVTRRLLDFCGLAFDAACLEYYKTQRAVLTPSAAQVRQPLHDTSRAAFYGNKLDALRERLRAAGVVA